MAEHTISGSEVSSGPLGLEANTVETVTFDGDENVVEVMAISGAADVYYSLDGSTPTIGGKNCYILPATAIGTDKRQPPTSGVSVVKLIAGGPVRVAVFRSDS